ncbi:hypothetical protein pb186bvf_007676 [Paramecium bursaria]
MNNNGLKIAAFLIDTNNLELIKQRVINKQLRIGQFISQNPKIKVLYLDPPYGVLTPQTNVLFQNGIFNQQKLENITLLNLSQEKKNTFQVPPLNCHLSQDQLIEIEAGYYQVISCKPEHGYFTPQTDYRIQNCDQERATDIWVVAQNGAEEQTNRAHLEQYFIVPRYIREGKRFSVNDREYLAKQIHPRRAIIDRNTSIHFVELDVNSIKFDEDERNDGLQMVNTLKVLQDKTASRNQFVTRRKKLYSMMEAHYDEKENQMVISLNSNRSINAFQNFPNTFLSQIHQDTDDLESDLMDCDETNQGMGAQEQNDKLSSMTLPVFFKNILASGRQIGIGASRQSRLQQPEQPFSVDDGSDSEFHFSESSLIYEDQPHLTALPRYFNEIVMFNSARRIPSNLGVPSNIIAQLPERQIDIDWVRNKGQDNQDFCKCMICLMEYKEQEYVRTLPCLHYFHIECIDFWLDRSKKCPICKTSCDQIY